MCVTEVRENLLVGDDPSDDVPPRGRGRFATLEKRLTDLVEEALLLAVREHAAHSNPRGRVRYKAGGVEVSRQVGERHVEPKATLPDAGEDVLALVLLEVLELLLHVTEET